MVAMQRITAHALPLVILLWGTSAHARSSDLVDVVAIDETSLNVKDPAATEQVKDDSLGNESVVQDWNLVCEELCRAGLGGPTCAPHCDILTQTYKETQIEAADVLLGDAKYDLCTILCASDLGEKSCGCSERTKLLKDKLNRDTICKAFCILSNITIAGCSRCLSQTYNPFASKTTTVASTKPRDPESIIKVSGFQTIQSGSAISSVQETTSSTTPDWNEVCISLCKIGEGGSLCNCDLPPFF